MTHTALFVLDWLRAHEALLWATSIASLVLFVGTLVFIPLFVCRIPPDYFCRRQQATADSGPSLPSLVAQLARNIVGIVLIIVGIAMLVLPGQGILTILIGLALTSFPGKQRLELRLLQKKSVFGALNWIRRKANQPPLRLP